MGNRRQEPFGCLVLFGVPFLAAGLFTIGLASSWWSLWWQSRDWVKVAATVESVKLDSHRGSKGGVSYKVSCVYRYRYGSGASPGNSSGREYTGSRVGLESGTTSGDAPRERFRILEEARVAGRPIEVLVDPSHPDRSLVFREPGVSMYMLPPFGLVFVLVGGGIMAFGWAGTRALRRRESRSRACPGRPWRFEDAWEHGFTVRSTTTANLWGAWGLGGFVSLFMAPFLVALSSDRSAPAMAWGVVGLFGLLAVGLVVRAVYLTLQASKYGVSVLELGQMPVVPGQAVAAKLVVPHRVAPEGGVTIRLVGKRITGAGKHQSIHEFHSAESTAGRDVASPTEDRSVMPFSIDLPADVPGREEDEGSRVEWCLQATAATPGVDFAAEFDLPVYRVEDPDQVELRPGW